MAHDGDVRHQQVSTAEAAALAVEYAERLLVGTVRDVHHAVSSRWFALTGPLGLPARLWHDTISGAVYGVLGAGLRATGNTLRRVDGAGRGGRALEETRPGRRAAAIVNGLIGESLEREGHPMALPMRARVEGKDVTDFAQAYPDATGNVVVFVHGLVEDDESWHWGAARGTPTYAERLAAETDWTPVTLRYNTGLPIVRNGKLLSQWLEALLRDWPTPVRQIALVGHSMGGLVCLAACEHGADSKRAGSKRAGSKRAGTRPAGEPGGGEWTSLVRHVLCLGTPHLGAPLEQLVYWGAHTLASFPESRPFATILNTRSGGILDLRRPAIECTPLAEASYHSVSGSLAGPLGLLLGDLLVRPESAAGRIPGGTAQHLPATHHFQLLNHPDVYRELHRRLTGAGSEQEETA